MDAGEAATAMDLVIQALQATDQLLTGMDTARSAAQLERGISYSPLRTLVVQSLARGEEVQQYLRTTHR